MVLLWITLGETQTSNPTSGTLGNYRPGVSTVVGFPPAKPRLRDARRCFGTKKGTKIGTKVTTKTGIKEVQNRYQARQQARYQDLVVVIVNNIEIRMAA